jgi:hypothetical protein
MYIESREVMKNRDSNDSILTYDIKNTINVLLSKWLMF